MIELVSVCQVHRVAQKYKVKLERIKEGKYILNEKLTIFVRVCIGVIRGHILFMGYVRSSD